MALTNFEKSMLTRIHDEIQRRQQFKKATDQDQTDLNTILHGSDEERQTLITTYITNVGIPRCTAEIADCDTAKTTAQALKTDMEAYVA